MIEGPQPPGAFSFCVEWYNRAATESAYPCKTGGTDYRAPEWPSGLVLVSDLSQEPYSSHEGAFSWYGSTVR